MKRARLSPLRRRWVRFVRDRAAHAYAFDRAAREWRSLCGRRSQPASEVNPYATAIRAEAPSTPVHDDPYGCCTARWARSFPGTRTQKGNLRRERR